MSDALWIALAVVAVLVVVALVVGLVRYRKRRISLSAPDTTTAIDKSGGYKASSGITFSGPTTAPPADKVDKAEKVDTTGLPGVGDDAAVPRDAPKRTISDVKLPEPPVVEPAPKPVIEPEPKPEPTPEPKPEPTPEPAPAPEPTPEPAPEPTPALPEIAPAEGRLERLRGRLAKSQNTLGRGMLGLLGGGDLDEESWEEIEDTLLIADLGPVVTENVIAALRAKMASASVRTEADARAVLKEVLVSELRPDLDRSIRALPHADKPSVLLVVGVNG
ncbi:signal recognition particle receptor subunit alpha, partial [Mycolicibacterium diernhoferi]